MQDQQMVLVEIRAELKRIEDGLNWSEEAFALARTAEVVSDLNTRIDRAREALTSARVVAPRPC